MRNGRNQAPLVLLAAALTLAACAVNPVTHRPELAVVSRSTELELGSEQAKAIAAAMGLVPDGPLVAYVRAVGARLAARSPRQDVPYAFHVVDLPEPNAFAVPGHVYVTRGLLILLNDEDELAGVLGHEIGHIAARHAVQHLSRALPAGIVTGLVSGVTGMASPLLGNLVRAGGELATDTLLAPYSREQEREADRVGQDIAAQRRLGPGGARPLARHPRARRGPRDRGSVAARASSTRTRPRRSAPAIPPRTRASSRSASGPPSRRPPPPFSPRSTASSAARAPPTASSSSGRSSTPISASTYASPRRGGRRTVAPTSSVPPATDAPASCSRSPPRATTR